MIDCFVNLLTKWMNVFSRLPSYPTMPRFSYLLLFSFLFSSPSCLACPPACLCHRPPNACVSAAAQTGLFKVLSNDTLSLITYRMKVDQNSWGRGANRTRGLQRRLDSSGLDSAGFSLPWRRCYVCVRSGRGLGREGANGGMGYVLLAEVARKL